MKDFFKKNFALILAFLLPVGLVLGIALSVYLPSVSISTDYNFLYATCGSSRDRYPYDCNAYLAKRFTVLNGKLSINSVEDSEFKNYSGRIFLHDTGKNESREISQEEALKMNLSGLLTSPDGITVSDEESRGYRGGVFPVFFFDDHRNYGFYLIKGKSRSRLNLINDFDRYYYQNNFSFIGWTLPDKK